MLDFMGFNKVAPPARSARNGQDVLQHSGLILDSSQEPLWVRLEAFQGHAVDGLTRACHQHLQGFVRKFYTVFVGTLENAGRRVIATGARVLRSERTLVVSLGWLAHIVECL